MRANILAVMMWLGAVCAPANPALAGDEPQVQAAQSIITAQIEAMRADDGPTAYSFASPEIQMKFPTPDSFMAMVKTGYAPVYQPRAFAFAGASVSAGVITQLVDISAADGSDWVAEYRLAAMPDGSLKIIGCQLKKPGGESA